jgi:hypothetical protein
MAGEEIRDIAHCLDASDFLSPDEVDRLVVRIQRVMDEELTDDDVYRLTATVLRLLDDHYVDRALLCTAKMNARVAAVVSIAPKRNSPANTTLLKYAGRMLDEFMLRRPIQCTEDELHIVFGYVATIHKRRVISLVCGILDTMKSTVDMIPMIEEFITYRDLDIDDICKLTKHVPANVTLSFATLRRIMGCVTSGGRGENKCKFVDALIRICPRIHNFGEAMSVDNFEWLFAWHSRDCDRVYQTRVCELLDMAVAAGLFHREPNQRSRLRTVLNDVIHFRCCAPLPLLLHYYMTVVFLPDHLMEIDAFVMRLIGYARDPILCSAVLNLFALYVDHAESVPGIIRALATSGVMRTVFSHYADIPPAQTTFVVNLMEKLHVASADIPPLMGNDARDYPFLFLDESATAGARLNTYFRTYKDAYETTRFANILWEAVHLQTLFANDAALYKRNAETLARMTNSVCIIMNHDCVSPHEVCMPGTTNLYALRRWLLEHACFYRLPDQCEAEGPAHAIREIYQNNMDKYTQQDTDLVRDVFPILSPDSPEFVFVDECSEVLDPSTCLCELLSTAALQVCWVSILIPPGYVTHKYVVSIHTEGATALLAHPWVLHKGLVVNLLAYTKAAHRSVCNFVKERLSHEMRERLSLASEALVRKSASLAIVHEFPELFTADVRRFAFRMGNLALPRRFEVWQREYRASTTYPVAFGRIYLPVSPDNESTGATMRRYCSGLISNAVNVRLAYSDITHDCTAAIFVTYANTLYDSVIDSVTKLPRAHLPSSVYTGLGVLFARSIYHALPLQLEVSNYFFELMFCDDACPESVLASYKLSDINPDLYGSIRDGAYRDCPFLLPYAGDVEVIPGGSTMRITSDADNESYLQLVASAICGAAFVERVKPHFLQGFYSVLPHMQHDGVLDIDEIAAMVRGSNTLFSLEDLNALITPDSSLWHDLAYVAMVRRVLHRMSLMNKRAFMFFVTGNDWLNHPHALRVTPRITVRLMTGEEYGDRHAEAVPPTADRVRHVLSVPRYPSEGVMKRQFESTFESTEW